MIHERHRPLFVNHQQCAATTTNQVEAAVNILHICCVTYFSVQKLVTNKQMISI